MFKSLAAVPKSVGWLQEEAMFNINNIKFSTWSNRYLMIYSVKEQSIKLKFLNVKSLIDSAYDLKLIFVFTKVCFL